MDSFRRASAALSTPAQAISEINVVALSTTQHGNANRVPRKSYMISARAEAGFGT